MLLGLQWYWWILIVIGVVVIGYIKIQIGKKIFSKKPKYQEKDDD